MTATNAPAAQVMPAVTSLVGFTKVPFIGPAEAGVRPIAGMPAEQHRKKRPLRRPTVATTGWHVRDESERSASLVENRIDQKVKGVGVVLGGTMSWPPTQRMSAGAGMFAWMRTE